MQLPSGERAGFFLGECHAMGKGFARVLFELTLHSIFYRPPPLDRR
jgi:hypothetical protein